MKNIESLKKNLEKLYKKYNKKSLIPPDPLQFVYQYDNPLDKEIVALLSSSLAYGNVRQIRNSLTKLFACLGPRPYDFVCSFTTPERKKLKNFKHRFNTAGDISDLLTLLKNIFRQNSTLEDFFSAGYNPADSNIIPALTAFTQQLLKIYTGKFHKTPPRSFQYLLPNPAAGSPCKRLNMFLRWMVRSDNIDTGLWKSIKTSQLIIPMDTHITRITKLLKFHNKKNISLKTAVKVTAGFAKINPDDPVKYDFALCRLGMENADNKFIKKLLLN